jgi:TonB family protein
MSDFQFRVSFVAVIGLLLLPFITSNALATEKEWTSPRIPYTNLEYGDYVENFQKSIRKNWHPPYQPKSTRAVAFFYVDQKGNITKLRMKKSSGTPMLDESILKAVQSSNPLAPPPRNPDRKLIPVEMVFNYNVSDSSKNILWEIYQESGDKSFKAGDFVQAEKYYRHALQEVSPEKGRPQYKMTLQSLAQTCQKQNKNAEAKGHLQKVLELIEKEDDGPEKQEQAKSIQEKLSQL